MPTYSFACIRCARVPSRVVTFGLAFYLNYLEFASVSLVLFHSACLKRRRCQLGKEHIDLWHSRWTLASVLAYCHCFSFNACFLCVFLSREIGSNFQFRILLTCPMDCKPDPHPTRLPPNPEVPVNLRKLIRKCVYPTHLHGQTLDPWVMLSVKSSRNAAHLRPDLGFQLVLELWGLEPAVIVRGHRICNAIPGLRISEACVNQSRSRAIGY